MSRNVLYFVIGALVVVAAVVGYLLYQEQNKTGIEIKIGDQGISVDGN